MKKTISNLKSKKADVNVTQNQISSKCDTQIMNVVKLVKPVDFEDFYSHNKNNISNDPNRQLVKIPDKDVEITRVSRKETVFNKGVPTCINEIFPNNLLAKLCVEFYTSEWVVTCYKEFAYSSAFWCLPNVQAQLSTVKEQKFLIDEEKDKDNESIQAFKTKGVYFEGQLAVCNFEDYQRHLKHRDNELANVTTSASPGLPNNTNNAIPKSITFSLTELNDGVKVLRESMSRDGHPQVILYLDVVESIREIGEYWIMLSFKGKQKDTYLYTGGKENQILWSEYLKGVIDTMAVKAERSGSQDHLERTEETPQGMLSKILQESEQSITALRKKEHQKILTIYPDVRDHIKKKSKPMPFHDTGLLDKSVLDDSSIRPQLEQSSPRRIFKVTAQKFLTGLYIPQENSGNKDTRILPEPFFISCCLIHIGDNRRISEVFQWNPNHPSIENLLPQDLFVNKWCSSLSPSGDTTGGLCNKTPLDLPTFSNHTLQNSKSFVVRTPYPNEQVGILIRVEKVFNGMMSTSVDKYAKYGGMLVRKVDAGSEVYNLEGADPKTGQSINKTMTTYCSNIGNYRMPFCWAVGRLNVDKSVKLRLYKYDGNKTSDEDLSKQINSINSEGNKVTSIPGYIELTVEELSQEAVNDLTDVVNSDLICKIKSNPADQSGCCKEVREFISDLPRSPIYPVNNQTKGAHSTDISSSSSNSKSHSNYGSSLSLHFSDDNSPGDSTPPGDVYFSNHYIKSLNSSKVYSASLGRISGSEVSNLLSSKSLDIQDLPIFSTSINQEDLVVPFLDFSHCLYLYPRTLNFANQSSFHRARNLSCFVELRDSDKLDSSIPLKVIFSSPSNKQPAFDSWANTSVTYHETTPTFNEEIKIALPVKLHSKHHLLFRFYHVSCDTAAIPSARDKASNKKHIETQVGFAWVPLLDPNMNLKHGTFNLPVSANLVSEYLSHAQTSLQWVEGQKPLFTVILKAESTIYTQNDQLHKFFQVCTDKLDAFMANGVEKKEGGTKMKNGCDPKDLSPKVQAENTVSPFFASTDVVEIKNAIKAFGTATVSNLINFLGPIFNQLLTIIVGTSTSHPEISKTAITSIITLSHTLRGQSIEAVSSRSIKRNTKILKNYIKYSLDAEKIVPARSKKTVHECLVQTISDLISPPFRDTILMNSFLYNSFLLYSIIVKSMIQSSSKQTKLAVDRSGEKLFTATFNDHLKNMIHLVINCVLEVSSYSFHQQNNTSSQRPQNSSTLYLASAANKDLARFIGRLLNVMDRGFIFERIHQYMEIINKRIDSKDTDRDCLSKMKFEFLEVICQHEHFIPLNLISPVNQSDKGSSIRKHKGPPPPELLLSEAFCQRHYLVGLVLQQVHQQMCNTHSSSATRRIPFVLIRNLLTKHIFDDRYNGNHCYQSRIAGLYLPFIAIILENQKALCMPGNSYSSKTAVQNMNDSSEKSMSSRPLSTFSGDTISTHSSINESGSDGAGGSIYGVSFGAGPPKSTRSSQVYMDKDGHVDSHFLNMIAGINPEGSLRSLSTRRQHDSDNSSVHSTSTLIGLEEMNEKEETISLGDEMVVRTRIELNADSSKRNSLQRSTNSCNNSLGKKTGRSLALNLKKGSGSTFSNQRISTGAGACNTGNKTLEAKSAIYLNEKTQKDVFLCLMHIFSTISAEDMKATICNLTVQERAEFLQLMIYAIHHLKYQGRKVINNFESISTSKLMAGQGQVQLRGQKAVANGLIDDVDQSASKAILEGNVSTEVGLIVLDVLAVYCSEYKQEILASSPDHLIFRRIVDIYLTLLTVNQSDTVLRHVLISMRVFVNTFAKVIFASCHSIICDLSLHVLRYCDSVSSSVRVEACGFLYRMMRCSYDTFNKPGFNRVHLQMIVAVSKLDRTVGRRFNQSLNYLKRLAELEMQKAQTNPPLKPKPSITSKQVPLGVHSSTRQSMQVFFEEVSDLSQRIRTVLMATVQMNEHKDDPEMLVDLQYSLAKSYSSNPALRRTWLEKIYAVHEKTGSRAEMAMCKAHVAAMICEYLRRKEVDLELYSIGCVNFKSVTPNIPSEECGMREDSSELEVHYTKEEVVKLLREVAQEFDSAGLWEVLRHIYKLLIPIYEKKREYEQLAQIYQHLASAYLKIKNSEATNQRLIGSYYRVVLYGKPFESLAGKVFIYRLDSGKQFCVAREELQALFERKYGAERVQMLVENHVDRGRLDPALASVQVTHVDPFFDEEEEPDRQSMFESQYNISKFLLETPFVKKPQSEEDSWSLSDFDEDGDGILKSKQTDDLSIQWKRRTILTVEASFPHLKRRLEVVSTKEIDFSPIERAIDEIKSKNRQLATHLAVGRQSAGGEGGKGGSGAAGNGGHAGNISLLMDMHLTGALLPQVNQGPMAYARVFLQREAQDGFPSDMVKTLKIQFMQFLTLCHLLLRAYYELMSHVHEPKYQAMRAALDRYRLELSNLLKEEVVVDEEHSVLASAGLCEAVRRDLARRLVLGDPSQAR